LYGGRDLTTTSNSIAASISHKRKHFDKRQRFTCNRESELLVVLWSQLAGASELLTEPPTRITSKWWGQTGLMVFFGPSESNCSMSLQPTPIDCGDTDFDLAVRAEPAIDRD